MKSTARVCLSTDLALLNGQVDSSERAHSTNPQQARGGWSDRAGELVTP